MRQAITLHSIGPAFSFASVHWFILAVFSFPRYYFQSTRLSIWACSCAQSPERAHPVIVKNAHVSTHSICTTVHHTRGYGQICQKRQLAQKGNRLIHLTQRHHYPTIYRNTVSSNCQWDQWCYQKGHFMFILFFSSLINYIFSSSVSYCHLHASRTDPEWGWWWVMHIFIYISPLQIVKHKMDFKFQALSKTVWTRLASSTNLALSSTTCLQPHLTLIYAENQFGNKYIDMTRPFNLIVIF